MTDVTTTIVELVRHASAGKRGKWPNGPDGQRPLDERGAVQAQQLGEALVGGGGDGDRDGEPEIAEIRSSPTVRCRDTVAPLAGVVGLDVIDDHALAEADHIPTTDKGSAWVASAWLGARALRVIDELARRGVERAVLCSHGDVIPAVMAALAGRDGLDLTDVACPKAGRWRVVVQDGRAVRADLIGPPTSTSPPADRPTKP